MNEVLQNIKTRHSTRAYTDRQVSAEDLDLILAAAAQAPSGMNMQTWHFTAVQNADKLKELNERVKGAFAKSNDPRMQERGHSDSYCCYYHAPTLVIVAADASNWLSPFDCACALENIFLAAAAEGLSCSMRIPLNKEHDIVKARLKVPPTYMIPVFIGIGYPDPDEPKLEQYKPDLDKQIRFGRWK